MSPRLPPRLVALSPGSLEGARAAERFARAVSEALEAGLRGILLREPALCDRELLALARELVERGRPRGAWVGVHDRLHVALAADAPAAHLGFRSLPPAIARRVVGEGLALGFSAHAGDAPGAELGADYLFLGPLHPTPKEHGPLAPLGLEGFARERARRALPVLAIGGLRPEHARAALAAGAQGLAVRGGIFGAADPAAAARAYLDALGELEW